MSGVGPNMLMTAGAQGALGGVRFSIMPQLAMNANRDHPTFVSGDAARNRFASPFYYGNFSADLPSRPGDGALLRVAPGESGAWWSNPRAFVGLLSTTPEWGPPAGTSTNDHQGPRGEGLVLGHSAPGLPRVELAYSWRPVSPANVLRLRWLTGRARESDWFDDEPRNDSRILSGARVEFDRAGWLRAGAARTVMSPSGRGTLVAAMQPLGRARSDSVIDFLSADVLFDLEEPGTTGWIELARQAPIRSARDFFRLPTEGIAFRLGLMQRLSSSTDAEWSLTVEAVRLDQSGTREGVIPNDLYTSSTVIQGWTHRGQPLGSGLGPGGQQQVGRIDRAGRVWRLAVFAERVRRNEDAMFREDAPASDRHDVTLEAGVSAARRVGVYDVSARISGGRRFNYLFQGPGATSGNGPVDLGVLRVGLSLSPAHAFSIVRPTPKS